jgi:hypothetical protein
MGDLPGLAPDDPKYFLSAGARRRIDLAARDATLLRARVLEDVEMRFRSRAHPEDDFDDYCDSGKPAIDLKKSRTGSARIILAAVIKEFRAVGVHGAQLLQIMEDYVDSVCNSFELSSIQRSSLNLEFNGADGPTVSWAVCQRTSSPTLREPPRLFPSRESADGFLNEELFTGVQNKNRGWQKPVPIAPLIRTGETARKTFREFLPPERIARRIPALSFDEALDQIFHDVYPEITCALAREWWFIGITKIASKRPGHHYTGVQYASVSEIVLHGVYDIEDSLRAHFGILPNRAIGDFFRSWDLWHYMTEFAATVARSSAAIQLAGHEWAAKDQATRTVDVLFEQFCVYAHELLPIADPTESPLGPAEVRPQAEADCVRRSQVDEFLRRCNGESEHRVLKKHIWLAVGHSKGRQFEYWQACDSENTTGEDERNFSRILKTEPKAFVALLRQRKLLPA